MFDDILMPTLPGYFLVFSVAIIVCMLFWARGKGKLSTANTPKTITRNEREIAPNPWLVWDTVMGVGSVRPVASVVGLDVKFSTSSFYQSQFGCPTVAHCVRLSEEVLEPGWEHTVVGVFFSDNGCVTHSGKRVYMCDRLICSSDGYACATNPRYK